MARDSGGTYTRVSNSFSNPVSNTTIDPSDAEVFFDEVETEMTDSLCRSGKGSMLANLSMGGFNITTASAVQIKGSSSGFTVIQAAAAASGTVTLPAATDTLVGKATTDTLTNKTFDTAGTGNSFSINGVAATANTGTGAVVRETSPTIASAALTSPTLTTPTLGVATATSINKVAITAPATSATLTLIDGTTLTGPAASGTAMTLGNTETVTGVKTFGSAGAVGRLKIAGTTSGTITLDATAVAGSNTLTLPAATDTLVGKATTDTLTNKTFNSAGTGNTLQVSSVTVSAGQYPGETSNGSATAGNVGEVISASVAAGSAIGMTSGAAMNITSISLTAGDWDVMAQGYLNLNTTTSWTGYLYSITTTSATADTTPGHWQNFNQPASVPGNVNLSWGSITRRVSISSTTTVYLMAQAAFTVSTAASWGTIWARRSR